MVTATRVVALRRLCPTEVEALAVRTQEVIGWAPMRGWLAQVFNRLFWFVALMVTPDAWVVPGRYDQVSLQFKRGADGRVSTGRWRIT